MKKNLKKQYIIGFIFNFILIVIFGAIEVFLVDKVINGSVNDIVDATTININGEKIILDGSYIALLFVNSIFFFTIFFTVLGSFIGTIKGYIVGKAKIAKEERNIKLDNPYIYFRELPNKFGIGVSSVLLDSDIEYNKDIVAAILDLCAKDYLKLEKESNNYKLTIINEDESKLLSNERYIMYHIKTNTIKDITYKDWYKLCVEDGISLGLFNERNAQDKYKKYKFEYKFRNHFLIALILTILIFIALSPNMKAEESITYIIGFIYLLIMMIVWVFAPYMIYLLIKGFFRTGKNQQNIVYKHILNQNLLKTEKGVEELHKLYAYRKFIRDFGSFVDKNIEQVVLWDYYLSYAQMFGLAKEILKTGYKKLTNNESFKIDSIDNIDLSNIQSDGKMNEEEKVYVDPSDPNVQKTITKTTSTREMTPEELEKFKQEHPNIKITKEKPEFKTDFNIFK